MTAVVLAMEQGSPEWQAARCGLATASMFATVMRTKGRGEDGDSKTRLKYARQIAAEIITGAPADTFTNAHMERGHQVEAEARDYYAVLSDEPIEQVGFIMDEARRAGCSPDALVGAKGLLEIKSALPDILVEHIIKGDFPPQHKAQTQGGLWLTEREWVDLAIYWPGMKPFVKRAFRDDKYIADLETAVARFNEEVDEIVAAYERYGAPSTLKADLTQSVLMAG